ncbi:universal stress protein [Streptomyces sp. CBMA123]|uniref:universal stress protein n=1 Tax=Streptomyces sp. CBMA123 TaxID=1896313 RepID=UPI00294FFF63|nr:universal stress protein [Streptomyces sp. CBMA123]
MGRRPGPHAGRRGGGPDRVAAPGGHRVDSADRGLRGSPGHRAEDPRRQRHGGDRFRRPVEIRTRVQEGGAAACLLDAARGAELLVVGSRGHGGFTGALLGSVGQHCVQHAPCPVVVVRHRND